MILRQEAIISSMTKAERKKPDLLNASRKKRIAAGAGVEVQDVNRLLKQHRQMADMVKSMSKGGGKRLQQMAAMMGGLGGGARHGRGPTWPASRRMGGGKMPEPSADEMKALQDRLCRPGRRTTSGRASWPARLPSQEITDLSRKRLKMLKIRLARGGAKKRPYYYIVVADSHSPRDGKFIERVGTYNPMLPRDGEQKRVTLKADRIAEWLARAPSRPTASPAS